MRKFLASVAMSENKTIGSMTERQRQAMAARLTIAQAATVHPNKTNSQPNERVTGHHLPAARGVNSAAVASLELA
jgi:hypothetical protein